MAKLDYSTKAECNRLMGIENSHLSNDELDELFLKLENPDSIPKVDKFTLTDPEPDTDGGEPSQGGIQKFLRLPSGPILPRIPTRTTTSMATPMMKGPRPRHRLSLRKVRTHLVVRMVGYLKGLPP